MALTTETLRAAIKRLSPVPDESGNFQMVAQPGSAGAKWAEEQKTMRWMLVRDDSGHNYCIPVSKEQAFEAWVAAYANEENGDEFWDNYFDVEGGEDFNGYRLNGSVSGITFLDPQDKR